MKFSKDNLKRKKINENLYVDEYFEKDQDLALDGAVAFINCVFGPKINRVFTELFFVLEGKLSIEIDDEVNDLYPNDLFIIKPDVPHTLQGDNAKVFISCSPPFDAKNMEFL